MARIRGLRQYISLRRRSGTSEVDAELRFHFEMAIRDLVERGLSPEAAREEAHRRFGDVERVRKGLDRIDRGRDGRQRWAEWWGGASRDLVFAVRGLRRSPGFTTVVVLTLALGIGANSAVFTVVDRLLLRPPEHVADAAHLRRVHVSWKTRDGAVDTRAPLSYPEFVALRDGVRAFDGVAAFNYPTKVGFGVGPDAPRIERSRVTGGFFRVLGVRPYLGRFFLQDDDHDSAEPTTVLSYGFWKRQFGGRPDVLGERIVLDGRTHTIIGVAPKGFSGADLDAPDVWVALAPAAAVDEGPKWASRKFSFGFGVVAHLRSGSTAERASAEATVAIRPAHAETFFAQSDARVRLGSIIPARRLDSRLPEVSIATRLAGAAGMVLLIVCANVANLLLTRALWRRREVAVRMALGGGRGRLMRQLFTESLLLAAIGSAAALLIAYWGGAALRALMFPETTWATPPVDARVLTFTLASAVMVGLMAGLAPALQSTQSDLALSLKSGWHDRRGHRSRVRSGLLLVQTSFSVVLLVGAGLFARSLRQAHTAHLGFDIDRMILTEVSIEQTKVSPADWNALFEEVAARARVVPGVERASVVAALPFWTITFMDLSVPGIDSLPPALRSPSVNAVETNYFLTSGMRVLAGRGFSSSDVAGSARVAVLNATMARLLWGLESPLGKCLKVGGDTVPCTEVVGVVRDARFQRIQEETPFPQYYVPLEQNRRVFANRYLAVRANGDVRDVARRVRDALRGIRPTAYVSARPMRELVDPEIRPWRLGATMFGTFGGLALTLAAIGLYGVVSFGVARRRRELGIRTALGARAPHVVRLVLTEGLRLTLVGLGLGIAFALAAGRLVERLLFDASPRDPLVFGAVSGTLVLAAVLATLAPAWRAARVDPVIALRAE